MQSTSRRSPSDGTSTTSFSIPTATTASTSSRSSSSNNTIIPVHADSHSNSQHNNHDTSTSSAAYRDQLSGNNPGTTTSTTTATTLKRKQTRTSNACERCKARKQKCVALSPQISLLISDGSKAANPSNHAPCRNCHESMSQCIFGPKPQRSKKAKTATTTSSNPSIITSRSSNITPLTVNGHSEAQSVQDHDHAHDVEAWMSRNTYGDLKEDMEPMFASEYQSVASQEENNQTQLPADFNAFWSAIPQSVTSHTLEIGSSSSASRYDDTALPTQRQQVSPTLGNAGVGTLPPSSSKTLGAPSSTSRHSPTVPSSNDNSFTQQAYDNEQQTKQAMALLQNFNRGSTGASSTISNQSKETMEDHASSRPYIQSASRTHALSDLRVNNSNARSIFSSDSRNSSHSSLDKLPPMPQPTISSSSHPLSHPQQSPAYSQTQVQSRNQYTSPADSVTSSIATSAETETSIEESAARGVAYISLEAAAESHYVGQSSGATWASLILNGIAASNSIVPRMELRSELHEKKPSRTDSDLRLPSAVAAFVLETVYRHIQPRYPFMDWIVLHNHWQDRDKYILAASEHRMLDRDESSIAFLILVTLAIGTQLCSRAEMRLPPSEEYYTLAMQYMDSIVQLHNLPNVQALLLLAMYSLHDSKGPSVWYLSGVAIRLCIGMGLHRRASPLQERTLSRYTLEMRKRIFWTAYTLDRTMAMSLGRPPGIADADIDAHLPNDVDCVDISQDPRRGVMTSMTSSIHVIKLMRIHSKIHRTAYSVNQEHITKDAEIWGMIGLLDDWEKGIPEAAASKDCWKVPCCSQEWFRNKSAEARLYLLRPSLVGPNVAESPFLTHAAQSAAFIGNAQRRLHQQGQPLSSSALYTLFLAGLTLLYAVYIRPTLLPSKEVFQAVRAFSNTLFSYSQHLKTAEPLHNIFEELSLHCLERMNLRPEHPQLAAKAQETSAPADWQEALFGTTNEINVATAGEFASLFESLGLPSGPGLQASDYEPLPTNGTGTGLDMDPFLLDFSWSQPLDLDWNM